MKQKRLFFLFVPLLFVLATSSKLLAKRASKKSARASRTSKQCALRDADAHLQLFDQTVITTASEQKKSRRFLVDKIEALVHGPQGDSRIFCVSDQNRRGIDGRMYSLRDAISETLVYWDALRFKIPIDDTVVKEHLNRTLHMFGLKPGQEALIFAQEGYSYEEGFEKFRLMYANNVMIDYRIKQGMFISEQEVISYYNEHPVTKEAKYQLKTAFITVDRQKGQRSRGVAMDIERFIKGGKGLDITWSDPYWIMESDLAETIGFVRNMSPEAVETQKVADGFQLYKMQKKKPERLVSLKKRYRDIVETLRKPKFELDLQNYRKSLFDSAVIVQL